MDAPKRLTPSKGLDVRDGRAREREGGNRILQGHSARKTALSPGPGVAVDKVGRSASDPADECGDLGVGANRLGRAVVGGKFLRGEHAVDLAVADDVDGVRVAAAPRPGQPVMAVGAGSAVDGPAADGTGVLNAPRRIHGVMKAIKSGREQAMSRDHPSFTVLPGNRLTWKLQVSGPRQ